MQCPICKKPVDPPTDPNAKTTFPFCSERCRLIDLGRWLRGSYQIPVASNDEEEDRPSHSPEDQ